MTRIDDLRETPETFTFRLYGGDSVQFERALATLKATVPAELRAWDAETSWWTVQKTPDTERALAASLPGFARALELTRRQLDLFGAAPDRAAHGSPHQ